jgi:hypothetical protein
VVNFDHSWESLPSSLCTLSHVPQVFGAPSLDYVLRGKKEPRVDHASDMTAVPNGTFGSVQQSFLRQLLIVIALDPVNPRCGTFRLVS